MSEAETDLQEYKEAIQLWNEHLNITTSTIQQVGQRPSPKKHRMDSSVSNIWKDKLQKCFSQDRSHWSLTSQSSSSPKYTQEIPAYDLHQRAIIRICETVQKTQEYPGCPSRDMLIISHSPAFSNSTDEPLKEQITWIESCINSRHAGWQSCVKLKVQFYAVFEEKTINESFADQICECHLSWELCSTLEKYLQRHHLDSSRLTFATLQLGSVIKDARAPLFGTWDLWQLNVEGLITSTLNQMVVTEDSLDVPPHTVDAFIKISLIAPYHVVSKIVRSASINKGQWSLSLNLLAHLGQLVWLKSDADQPELLLLAVSDIINRRHHKWTFSADVGVEWTTSECDNLVKMIEGAMTTGSRSGVVLLHPEELLESCVIPFLDKLSGCTEDGKDDPFVEVVSKIILTIYSLDSRVISEDKDLLGQSVHCTLLMVLLRLQSQMAPWSIEYVFGTKVQKAGICSRGGQHVERVYDMCEAVVKRLASAMENTRAQLTRTAKDHLNSFVRDLNRDKFILQESKLAVVPFILACKRNVGIDIPIPQLPNVISVICKRPLGLFHYAKPWAVEPHRPANLGLITAFVSGRMCDEAMHDITQAIGASPAFPESDSTKTMAVAVLYRTMSISTRSQSRRLFSEALMSVIDALGGPSLNDMSLFESEGDVESTESQLGTYWESFVKGVQTVAEKTVLVQLLVAQPLIQLALDPFPENHRCTLAQIYDYGIGFDMLVDYTVSHIQHSLKASEIDWSMVSLDFVLFSFMAVCRMNRTMKMWSTKTESYRRTTPSSLPNWMDIRDYAHHQILKSDNDVDSQPSSLSRIYSRTTVDVENEDHAAAATVGVTVSHAKARDELVLMAMNFSEEIVRRQDSHYELTVKMEEKLEKELDRRRRQELKTSGNARRKRQKDNEKPKDKSRIVDSQDTSVVPEEEITAVEEEEDILTLAKPPKAAEGGLKSEQSISAPSTPTSTTAMTPMEIAPMLSSNQQKCLLLALSYLPTQEQSAVRVRLARLLKPLS
ncbi:hypothetical protein BG004_004371 [Podila humilis]|nr:hypothetical protein BG004_004371 [Podila humilis]